jgi:hypothetical protein
MPDLCTPEHERALARMGAWLPYRCARRFLSEFFPLGDDPPWHETIRCLTTRVGAGLDRESLSQTKTPRAAPPSALRRNQTVAFPPERNLPYLSIPEGGDSMRRF